MTGRKPNRALQRAYRRYPSLFPFGLDDLPHLTAEEEMDAPFEARLRSAWAYIVTVAIRAWKAYKEREKACVGLEDAMQDVVVALIEKDASFDPSRGRYTTFAKLVATQAVAARRRHARAVSAPTGPVGRLRRYQERADEGTLGVGGRRTLECLRVVLDDQDSIGRAATMCTGPDDVPEEVGRREAAAIAAREVVDAIPHIGPVGASVLARRWGLFQAEGGQSPGRIAQQLPGHGPRQIRAIEDRAIRALHDHVRTRRRDHACSCPHRHAGGVGGCPGGDRGLSDAADRAAAGYVPEPADGPGRDAAPEPGDGLRRDG